MWLVCAVRDGPGRRADRTGQRLESWYEENAMTATTALRGLFGRL
jgi:hypothetical protein